VTSVPQRSHEHEGACHCGAIGFAYRTALEPKDWPIRACQCTFCRAHGALSTSDPNGSLTFWEHVPATLNRYQFGRKTADFLICRRCGAYLGATMQSEGKSFGIVNVRWLQSVLEHVSAPQPMTYENEAQAERLARREKRWTPIAVA
jgi:hypothetical protein